MALLLLKISAICYGLVAVVGLIQLRWPRQGDGNRTVLVGLWVAAGVHVPAISSRAAEVGGFPVGSFADGLSLLGVVMAGLAVFLVVRRVPQAVALSSVVITAMLGLAVSVYPADGVAQRLRSTWLPFHITFSFLGIAAFAVAAVVAVVYLVQERRLKTKKRLGKGPTGAGKLPALEVLDQSLFRLIKLGFPLMGLGLLFGVLNSKEVSGEYWKWNVLNTLAVLVWALFAILLNLRLTIGWRGRSAAMLTVVGVVVLLAALVGLSLISQNPHAVGS